MKIKELVTYNWKHLGELPEGKEREFVQKAVKSLEPFSERIAKENEAMVNLGKVIASFQGFKDQDLEKEVRAVISRTLYQ